MSTFMRIYSSPETAAESEVNFIEPLIDVSKALTKAGYNGVTDTARLLALQALEGLRAFRAGNFSLFDPSVGDEACQIRDLMVLEFAYGNRESDLDQGERALGELVGRINDLRAQIAAVDRQIDEEKKAACAPFKERKESVNAERTALTKQAKNKGDRQNIAKQFNAQLQLIQQEEQPIGESYERRREAKREELFSASALEAPLSKSVRQLALCYLLAKCKIHDIYTSPLGIKEYRDLLNVKALKLPGISYEGELLANVVECAKRVLNKESVECVRDHAQMIPGKRKALLMAAVEQPLSSNKSGYEEVSFYHGVEVIMKMIKEMGVPILLRSRLPSEAPFSFSSQQLFVAETANGKTSYVPGGNAAIGMPVLVIDGIGPGNIQQAVESAGSLTKMVRLNAAAHRFCTGQEDADVNILADIAGIAAAELEKIRGEQMLAAEGGFARGNPAAFVIDHIFVDTLNTPKEGDNV